MWKSLPTTYYLYLKVVSTAFYFQALNLPDIRGKVKLLDVCSFGQTMGKKANIGLLDWTVDSWAVVKSIEWAGGMVEIAVGKFLIRTPHPQQADCQSYITRKNL